MQILDVPFNTTDWRSVPPTTHPGEQGTAHWRTLEVGNIRVRMVEYSAGYIADHWCERGHVLLVLKGELLTELKNGESQSPRETRLPQTGAGGQAYRSVMTIHSRFVVVLGLLAGCSCPPPPASPPNQVAPDQVARATAAATPGLPGAYEGYVEGQGDDLGHLLLTISAVDPDGTVHGTLQFSPTAEPLPDPPPGLDHKEIHTLVQRAYGGYEYPLTHATLQSDRLRFGANLNVVFAGWCAKQKTYQQPGSPDTWSCAPQMSHGDRRTCYVKRVGEPKEETFDCTAVLLCEENVCSCDASTCKASHDGAGPAFDMVVEGNSIHGAMGSQGTARFKRVAK